MHVFCFSLVEDKLFVMMSQSEDNVEYDDAFRGNHLVDWMVKNKHNGSRQEAVNEGKRLLQADIIHHGIIIDCTKFLSA